MFNITPLPPILYLILQLSCHALKLLLQRIDIEGIRNDTWFKRKYVAVKSGEDEEVNLDDVHAVFNDIEVSRLLFSDLLGLLMFLLLYFTLSDHIESLSSYSNSILLFLF